MESNQSKNESGFIDKFRRKLIGAPRDIQDSSIFHKISLIPVLAWIGLGADSLSSSSYGPEEAFRALGEHTYLAVFLAPATALTVFIISYAYSRIIVQSAATPLQGGGAITPSASTIESLMLPMWLELTRGGDKPDLIVMANDYYTFYEQSQTSIKRYMDSAMANGGFTSLKYHTADVIFDGGSGITAAHAYFINTDYLELVVHRDANMTEVPELRAINQDAVVMPIIWQGNLVTSNRSLQGVMKA